jgi:hypothetical protein
VYLTQQAKSDPSVILELRDRQYAAELVATALVHFDLFSWLSDRDDVSVEELTACFGFVDRPLDVLLTLCRSCGFLEGAEQVSLTTLGREHLAKSSPCSFGPYYAPIQNTPISRTFREVLITGSRQTRDDGREEVKMNCFLEVQDSTVERNENRRDKPIPHINEY